MEFTLCMGLNARGRLGGHGTGLVLVSSLSAQLLVSYVISCGLSGRVSKGADFRIKQSQQQTVPLQLPAVTDRNTHSHP